MKNIFKLPHIVKTSFKYSQPAWSKVTISLFYYLLANGIALLLPLISMYIIDKIIGVKDLTRLNTVIILLCSMILFNAFLNSYMYFVQKKWEELLVKNAQLDFFEYLMNKNLLYFTRHPAGSITTRFFISLSHLKTPGIVSISQVIGSILRLFAGLGIMIYLSPRLTMFAVLVIPLLVIPTVIFSDKVEKASRKIQDRYAEAYNSFEESVAGILLIKQLMLEKLRRDKVIENINKLIISKISLNKIQSYLNISKSILLAFGPVLILWIGARDVIGGVITLGMLIAFSSYMTYLYAPVGEIVSYYRSYRESHGALDNVDFDDIELSIKQNPKSDSEAPVIDIDCITGENLDFSYDRKKYVIKNLSFNIEKNKIIQISGINGVGKSTLVRIISGHYIPMSGHLAINHIDFKKFEKQTIRKNIYLIGQDTFLFSGTVLDNFQLAAGKLSEPEIIEKVKSLNLDYALDRTGLKWDTFVGERGIQLSRGQRQVVSIVQALLFDPKVLILDEATVSLSQDLEQNLFEIITSRMNGRILIAITHNKNLSGYFNDIVELKQIDKKEIVHEKHHAHYNKRTA